MVGMVFTLLDKIITDYLKKEGLLTPVDLGLERRRFVRESIPLTSRAIFNYDEKLYSIPGVVRDISFGGVKLVFPKGAEIKIAPGAMLSHFELSVEFPKDDQNLIFACDARHIHRTDSEIQIGASFKNIKTDQEQRLSGYLQ